MYLKDHQILSVEPSQSLKQYKKIKAAVRASRCRLLHVILETQTNLLLLAWVHVIHASAVNSEV